jgi:hypothetical protein
MNTGVVWLIFFIVFIANIFASIELKEIARIKGFDNQKYFWWALLLPMYGIPMVIALPDRGSKNSDKSSKNNFDELPTI